MRRAMLVLPVVVVALVALLPTGALSQDPRLVVFEAFIASHCGNCRAAAPEIERLAEDYHDQRVVFLEHNSDNPLGSRYSRFTAAEPGAVQKPHIIVDSGHAYTSGLREPATVFYTDYKALVDAELARPAQAVAEAYSTRVGDVMHVYLQVQNLSGTTLSAANDATATAIVYQDVVPGAYIDPGDPEVGYYLTGRFARSAPSLPVASPLAPEATQGFSLNSTALSGYDWSKLHSVAFVDYRPGGSSGAYDMLQAVVPTFGGLELSTDLLQFNIDPATGTEWSGSVQLTGPSFLTWTTASDQQWLTVDPPLVTPAAMVNVNVDLRGQVYGAYSGHITFSATAPDGVQLQKVLAVSGYYGTTNLNCYALTVAHSGEGADPSASPAASDGCSVGRYRAGALVQLTAAPAANWEVAGWSGTEDDASLTATNTLLMPARAHTATVHYEFRDECVAPGAAAPISPSAGLTLKTATPTFTWGMAAGADGYRVQVCGDAECHTVVLEGTTSGGEHTAAAPLSSGSYYWRVQAINSSNDCLSGGAWSGSVHFYVCLTPGVPALVSPAAGERTLATQPLFTWAAVADADEYQVQIDGGTFAAFDTNYTPATALADGLHTWRVRAHNSAGGCSSDGQWSQSRTLVVGVAQVPSVFTYLPLLLQ
ncbi:MAG: InlB B-repeat-containing protein [Anaerolineae bacterium]